MLKFFLSVVMVQSLHVHGSSSGPLPLLHPVPLGTGGGALVLGMGSVDSASVLTESESGICELAAVSPSGWQVELPASDELPSRSKGRSSFAGRSSRALLLSGAIGSLFCTSLFSLMMTCG